MTPAGTTKCVHVRTFLLIFKAHICPNVVYHMESAELAQVKDFRHEDEQLSSQRSTRCVHCDCDYVM